MLASVGSELRVWASHGDFVKRAPAGFTVTATSANAPVAAMADEDRRLYALLFHPEVAHTDQRHARSCATSRSTSAAAPATGRWRRSCRRRWARSARRSASGRVVCGLSGGVDSTVAALLIHQAIGDRLTCIFVDNGVMRLDEAAQIRHAVRAAAAAAGVRRRVRAVSRSAGGVTDPEKKRKIIGAAFIEVFEAEAKKLAAKQGGFDFLAQGTLYPDVIESVSVIGPSHVIKSHHNVGGLPEGMRFKLVEPLRQLFKDEVRAVGKEMGLDDEFVWRQPFPGPGLAVRILGEVDAVAARPGAQGRRDRRRGSEEGGLVPPAVAVVRRAAAGPERRRHGGRADLRVHGRDPRGREPGRDDGRLGAPAARSAGVDLVPHRQRGRAASTACVYDISSKPPSTSNGNVIDPTSSTCIFTPSTRCSTARAGSKNCSTRRSS